MDTDTLGDLAPADIDALQRCLEQGKRDRELGAHYASLHVERGFYAAATAACYNLQRKNLKLQVHQTPPFLAWPDRPDEPDKEAQRLLNRMLNAGLSGYEPNPREALKRAGASRG